MPLPVLLAVDDDRDALDDVETQLARRYAHDYRIESLGDRSDRVELLAHHYVTALELGTASGVADRLPDRARGALLEAADRALGMSAYAAAARFYRSAFELLGDDVPPTLRYRYAKARMYNEEVLPENLASIAGELADSGDLETASEIESETLLGQLLRTGSAEDGANALVSYALRKGGRDNATALVIEVCERFVARPVHG